MLNINDVNILMDVCVVHARNNLPPPSFSIFFHFHVTDSKFQQRCLSSFRRFFSKSLYLPRCTRLSTRTLLCFSFANLAHYCAIIKRKCSRGCTCARNGSVSRYIAKHSDVEVVSCSFFPVVSTCSLAWENWMRVYQHTENALFN